MHETNKGLSGAELMATMKQISGEYERWAKEWLSDTEKLLEEVGKLVGAEFTDSGNHWRNLLLCAAGRHDEAREGMARMAKKRPKNEPLASAHRDATDAIAKLLFTKEHIKARRAHAAAREAFSLGAYIQRLVMHLEKHGYVVFRDRWLVKAGQQQRAILGCFVEDDSCSLQDVQRAVWPQGVQNRISPSRSSRARLDTAIKRVNEALAEAKCSVFLSVCKDRVILS